MQEFGKNAAQTTAAVSDKLGNTQSYERYQAAKTLLEAKLQNTDSEAEKAAIRASLGQVNAYLAENQSRYDTWKEGGIGRSILHGAAGGLTTGNLGGILAGGGTSLAAPYLDKAAENFGPAGKAAVNALGGAAIGYAAGGNVVTAAVGANVDWNNRRLHDSEIRKIKNNAAKFAKLHPGISQRQAEERLVAQAMRQVDAAYYAKHADTDTAAEQFLRSIAGSFKADGETFLDFAPMKYYRDSGKFAEQQGYRETREQLKRNAVSSYTQRSRQIRNKTFDTATAGVGKGIANLPSSYLNGFIGLYNGAIGKPVGKEAPYVPLIMEYDNPVEEEVGAWAADKFDRAAGILTGIKAGAVSSGRGAWNKNGKTGAGQKTGEMSVLDGEMAGGNKPRKQTNHEINKLKSADEINFADGMGKFTDSMDDKAFSRLVKSVKENGFTNPVVEYVEINGKAYIVRGNNRVFAAEYLSRIHELKFKKVDFPVPNTSWKNPTDVLNESGNVKRPRYRSK